MNAPSFVVHDWEALRSCLTGFREERREGTVAGEYLFSNTLQQAHPKHPFEVIYNPPLIFINGEEWQMVWDFKALECLLKNDDHGGGPIVPMDPTFTFQKACHIIATRK